MTQVPEVDRYTASTLYDLVRSRSEVLHWSIWIFNLYNMRQAQSILGKVLGPYA